MKKIVARNRGPLILIAVFLIIGGEAFWELLRAARYGLALAFLIASAIFASAVVNAFRDSKYSPEHASFVAKVWDMPPKTTRAGLWIRAGVVTFAGLALYFGFKYDSWLDDGKINSVLLALDGIRVLLWLPVLYWVFRRQYNAVPSHQCDPRQQLLQRVVSPIKSSRHEVLIVVAAIVFSMGILAVIGMWFR